MITDLHIPQSIPNQMIGVLVDFNDKGATSEFWVGAVSPFVMDGMMTASGIVENISQTCYAWLGEMGESTNSNASHLHTINIKNVTIKKQPHFGDIVYTTIQIVSSCNNQMEVHAESWVEKDLVATADILILKRDYSFVRHKKVIIVGGGVSGLITGAMLANIGINVTILEQNKNIGGGLLCFYKNGVWWDTGIHCIQGLHTGSWCWSVLDELGINVEVEQTEPIVIHGGEDTEERSREFLYPVQNSHRMRKYRQQTFGYGDQRLIGGSRSLCNQLQNFIITHCGKIINGSTVTFIDTNTSGSVSRIVTSDGAEYMADAYVSSIHIKQLMSMCNVPLFKESTTKRIIDSQESSGSIGVFVKLKPRSFPYLKAFHYFLPDDIAVYCPCDEKNQQWSNSLVLYQWVDYCELKPWHQKRDDNYYIWKENHTNKILQRAYECLPGLKDSIESYFTATSLTFRDEFHSPEGALYGIADKLQTVHTKIPNLILTGQSCFPHGFANMLAISVRTRDAVLEYMEKCHKYTD